VQPQNAIELRACKDLVHQHGVCWYDIALRVLHLRCCLALHSPYSQMQLLRMLPAAPLQTRLHAAKLQLASAAAEAAGHPTKPVC
jgi:hypothetical protein